MVPEGHHKEFSAAIGQLGLSLKTDIFPINQDAVSGTADSLRAVAHKIKVSHFPSRRVVVAAGRGRGGSRWRSYKKLCSRAAGYCFHPFQYIWPDPVL